ncbi:hypothetical protein LFX25_02965 [Leptospira sp. FAT2]|uniref:LIC10906 family membrane protein n=1 Tax=Leptospira sanjuanensis TaxID=2879643 RepID=UPI001EE7E73A|nr:hypothetical protein [Leptospira sanjuanensis]MCG6192204.1 hypothetical protein [Leptospira sanjuanensis]
MPSGFLDPIVFLNLTAVLFFISLGLYVAYPKPRKAVQIHFSLLTSCLGLWFLSFIIRPFTPHAYFVPLINLGFAISVPAPFLIFLISESYHRKPNRYILYPHIALVTYFFYKGATFQVLTMVSKEGEPLRFHFSWVYVAVIVHALVASTIAIGRFGIRARTTRGKTRTASILMLLGLIPPLISIALIWYNPTMKAVFSRGQAAIGCIIGILIWSIAILNCNGFRIPAFSLIEPKLPWFHRFTKPVFITMMKIFDPEYYSEQELKRKRKIALQILIHNNELSKDHQLTAKDRALILARVYANHLR